MYFVVGSLGEGAAGSIVLGASQAGLAEAKELARELKQSK